MIDSIPSASPAMPAIPSTMASTGQAAADPANNGGSLTPLTSGSTPQATFASTLQSRLRLVALNKAAVSVTTAATAKQGKLPELAITFAELARQTAQMTANAVPVDAKQATDTDNRSSRAGDNADNTVTAAAADPATMLPLAINAINPPVQTALPPPPAATPAQAALPQHPAALTAATDKDLLLQEASSAAINSNSAEPATEPAPAAVLAAVPEKTAPAAANQDGKTGETAFADMLHNSLPQAIANLAPPQAPPPVASLPIREIASPVAAAHWASDVGNQLSWMVSQRESRADLVLNPPQLGRIEVSITLNGDQASASFVSANPEVRAALHDSLPRLREVLADAGVFLGQANIGAESFRQGGNGAEKGRKSLDDSLSPTAQSLLGSGIEPLSMASSQQTRRGTGLIDLFA